MRSPGAAEASAGATEATAGATEAPAAGATEAPAGADDAPAGPLAHAWRVRFAESDRQDVVFNAHYLAWFDDNMTELFRTCFGSYDSAVRRGIDIVLAEVQMRFRAPARFDDELSLEVAVEHLGTTSIITRHAVRRDGVLLVEGTLRHVTVDPATLTKTPMPAWFRDAMTRWASVPEAGTRET